MRRRNFEQDDPLEQPSRNNLQDFDESMYGALPGIPDSGRVIAKPTDIYSMRPDRRQPRRLLPQAVRGSWDGDPVDVPILLGRWLNLVSTWLGVKIPIEDAIVGAWEPQLTDAQKADPVVAQFLETISLAVTIKHDGQRDPVEYAGDVLIDGERRWWAFHMLNLWVGSDYAKILAVVKPKPDVWAQATKNGARVGLNAISMARQIALLIMDMYEQDAGADFNTFDALVLPGEIDRRFYAQVRDGNLYPIKRGMGERVKSVIGVKSDSAVRNYRALLSIPDTLWLKADEQNWTEWQIRDYLVAVKADNADVTLLHGVADVTVSDGEIASPPTPLPEAGEGRQTGGVYVKPPPILPAKYDDEFEDTEEEIEEADYPDYEAQESQVAILAGWTAKGHNAGAVLSFMKQLAKDDPKLRLRITELMTYSRENLRKDQTGTREGWWETYLESTGSWFGELLEREVIKVLREYFEHLREQEREIREKNERRR